MAFVSNGRLDAAGRMMSFGRRSQMVPVLIVAAIVVVGELVLLSVYNHLVAQRELANTENTIGQGRQQYNALVASYNAAVLSFPNNLLAGPFGFQPQPFFEVQDAAQREAPVVKFT